MIGKGKVLGFTANWNTLGTGPKKKKKDVTEGTKKKKGKETKWKCPFLLDKDRLSLKLIGAIYFLTTNREQKKNLKTTNLLVWITIVLRDFSKDIWHKKL